jgi:antitoxin VapB
MSLNIKNPETYTLAAELARRLDISMTEAVTIALKDKLAATARADEKKSARVRRILEIAQACASRLSPDVKALDHGDLLYDDQGLPR